MPDLGRLNKLPTLARKRGGKKKAPAWEQAVLFSKIFSEEIFSEEFLAAEEDLSLFIAVQGNGL